MSSVSSFETKAKLKCDPAEEKLIGLGKYYWQWLTKITYLHIPTKVNHQSGKVMYA
jgi:hypothetical protein